MDYSIKINEFEGPLDLLLHLIKQANIDILDIEISEVTRQYLDYIEHMESLNINIASDYLVMAAELIEIKSRSLLPIEVSNDEIDEVIPTKENLINKLLEYQKYKDMTTSFKELETKRQEIYIKPPERMDEVLTDINLTNNGQTVSDLVDAFNKFLERVNLERPLTTKITNKEYSVRERKKAIKDILKEKHKVLFTELFTEHNISYIIVTFLSILEMTKESTIILKQDNNFQDITIELRCCK